jgi:virginiamycin B lyase
MMSTRSWLASASVLALSLSSHAAIAQERTALSGQVSSAEEGAMEGVVVSAKRAGSTITISVVTDAQGRYAFPADKLAPGDYALKARATGYDVDGPAIATLADGKPATSDIKLRKTKNLSTQMTNAEWLTSMPGTDEQKKFLLNCNSCHTYERIVKSTYDAEGFLQIFDRMASYYPGSTPLKPQPLAGTAKREGLARDGDGLKTAEWLASVNLSQQPTWSWPLQTLPRLQGRSTRVVITEYDLPNKLIEPHDVILDRKGMVWYSDFGQMFLGSMDPATGKVAEYPIPETKKGWSLGTLDLEADKNDDLWVGVMYQASIAKFDRATSTFKQWSIPKEWDSDAAQFGHLAVDGTPVDNKVWLKNSDGNNIYRLDLTTNTMESLGSFKDPATGKRIGSYGIHSDSKNNLYLLDFSASNIGRIDAKTKELSVFVTPTPKSRPRRGRVDAQDRLWFAEYGSDGVGMLDPATKQIKEWRVPTKWSAPYDAMVDKYGDAWTGSMMTDRVARIDTNTGDVVEYPLPRSTNIRRVYVDDRTKPSTLWVGNNHGASIVKIEPLD